MKKPHLDYEFSIVKSQSQQQEVPQSTTYSRSGENRSSQPVNIGRTPIRNSTNDRDQSIEEIDLSCDSGVNTSPDTDTQGSFFLSQSIIEQDQLAQSGSTESMSQSTSFTDENDFPPLPPSPLSKRTRSQTGSGNARRIVHEFSSDSEPETNSEEEDEEDCDEEWETSEDLQQLAKTNGRYSPKYVRFLLRLHERGVTIRSIQVFLRFLKKEFPS